MALNYPFWVNDFDRVKDHRINYPLSSKIFEEAEKKEKDSNQTYLIL